VTADAIPARAAAFARFAQAFLILSLLITFAKLSGETARDYLFTLIAAVLGSTAAPYLAASALSARATRAPWVCGWAFAGCVYGAVDVPWRMQAFFFPTGWSDASMAIWLPLGGVVAMPLVAAAGAALWKPRER
jgi:hypothetical protein